MLDDGLAERDLPVARHGDPPLVADRKNGGGVRLRHRRGIARNGRDGRAERAKAGFFILYGKCVPELAVVRPGGQRPAGRTGQIGAKPK
jgi:hypothetical protein